MASCAWLPTLISPTELASTVALTIHEFSLMTSTCASEDEDEDEPVDEPPLPPFPPFPPFPPDDELPETDSPTVRFTSATTPAMGDVNVADLSWSSAEASWLFAAVSAAESAAVWVSSAPLVVSSSTLACAFA